MTERAQNADFRRKPQIFADSPLLLEIQAFGGRRKPQKTADFRRKPKIFAENRRKPQIGLRHLRSVTFSSANRVKQTKMALKISPGGWDKTTPKKPSCNFSERFFRGFQRPSQRPSQRQISLSEALSLVAPNRVAPRTFSKYPAMCKHRKPQVSAGKFMFLQEKAFFCGSCIFCRKMKIRKNVLMF